MAGGCGKVWLLASGGNPHQRRDHGNRTAKLCLCVCDLVDHVSVRSATYVKDGVCVSVVGTAVFPFFCSAPTMPLPSVARQLAFFP